MAKAGVQEGVAVWKILDRQNQIYLGGLAVAFFFSILFDVISVTVNMPNMPGGLEGLLGKTKTGGSVSAYDFGANGQLAVLAALAGIGIWIWNFKSAQKQPWVPKALAGCAGFSALMFLVLMFRSGGSSSPMVDIDVDMTFLGFWVPFAGAIAATVVSVKMLRQQA